MQDAKTQSLEILYNLLLWQNICTNDELDYLEKFIKTGIDTPHHSFSNIYISNTFWGKEITIGKKKNHAFAKLEEYSLDNVRDPPLERAEHGIIQIDLTEEYTKITLNIIDQKLFYNEYKFEELHLKGYGYDPFCIDKEAIKSISDGYLQKNMYSNHRFQFKLLIEPNDIKIIENNLITNIPENRVFERRKNLETLTEHQLSIIYNVLYQLDNWQQQSLLTKLFDENNLYQLLSKVRFKELIDKYFGVDFYYKRMEIMPKQLVFVLLKASNKNIDYFNLLYNWITNRYKLNREKVSQIFNSIEFLVLAYYEDRFGHTFSDTQKSILGEYLDVSELKPDLEFRSIKRIEEEVNKHYVKEFQYRYPIFNLDETYNILVSSKKYKFVFISSNNHLRQEAKLMSHCVSSFAYDVSQLTNFVYHLDIVNENSRGYTIMLKFMANKYNIDQIKGFANSVAPRHVFIEVERQIGLINQS